MNQPPKHRNYRFDYDWRREPADPRNHFHCAKCGCRLAGQLAFGPACTCPPGDYRHTRLPGDDTPVVED